MGRPVRVTAKRGGCASAGSRRKRRQIGITAGELVRNVLGIQCLAPRDGNGPGRPVGSLAQPKILGPLGQSGRPYIKIGSAGPASSDPLGQQGRPTYRIWNPSLQLQ
jgi:hypothetical protein